MSREAVEQLIDKWMNEPTFRKELRQDPEGTVRKTGVSLSQDEWSALRSVDCNQTDEQLQSRANFAG